MTNPEEDLGVPDRPAPTEMSGSGMSPDARRRVVVGLVALVVVVAIVLLATRNGEKADETAGQQVDDIGVLVAPTSPPQTIGGLTWRSVKGDWRIKEDEATIQKAGALGFSMVVTNADTNEVSVGVKLAEAAAGAGLVFRYQGPFDFWTLRTTDKPDTWQLVRVERGDGTVVRDIGDAPAKSGTEVRVITRPNGSITISFNGDVKTTLTESALAEKTFVGLVAAGPKSSRAVFTDFTVEDA